MSSSIRSLVGQVAALSRWAECPDRSAATAPGRAAFLNRFLDQVDPDRVLPEEERARRAQAAMKAYFARLGLKSAQSRRRAAQARQDVVRFERDAAEADAELSDLAGGDAA